MKKQFLTITVFALSGLTHAMDNQNRNQLSKDLSGFSKEEKEQEYDETIFNHE